MVVINIIIYNFSCNRSWAVMSKDIMYDCFNDTLQDTTSYYSEFQRSF